jgi:hypothetical protein
MDTTTRGKGEDRMKVIAMIDRSAGNDAVGEMWTETRSFDITETLEEVYDWAAERVFGCDKVKYMTTNIKLSIDQTEERMG